MTMFRMPIFTWNIFVTAFLVLLAFPVLTAALLGLAVDRHFGAHVFDPANGGTILWQHLFWFFGHPEVYIVALPFFGIVTEVFPVFSRKPLFGYKGMVFATLAIAMLSSAVWAHHMYATGAVLLPFFSLMSFLIAVPTGVKFVNWIGTMWRGKLTFETPMLFALGFAVTFLFGGMTGVLLASPPLDFHVSDSYFVVAHFHYVLFGTIVFATYSGIYFWFPKMTGRMLDETLGKIHFWLTFIGFHTTFLVQHWLGNEGMPRRYVDYLPTDGFSTLNAISSIGAFVLGLSTLPFMWNVFKSYRYGRVVTVDDPWGFGNSLEWATSCPPPRHNFTELPRIRSERPAFELHYPEYVERFRTEAHVGGRLVAVRGGRAGGGPRDSAERGPEVTLSTSDPRPTVIERPSVWRGCGVPLGVAWENEGGRGPADMVAVNPFVAPCDDRARSMIATRPDRDRRARWDPVEPPASSVYAARSRAGPRRSGAGRADRRRPRGTPAWIASTGCWPTV